jgi:hypothetical protein
MSDQYRNAISLKPHECCPAAKHHKSKDSSKFSRLSWRYSTCNLKAHMLNSSAVQLLNNVPKYPGSFDLVLSIYFKIYQMCLLSCGSFPIFDFYLLICSVLLFFPPYLLNTLICNIFLSGSNIMLLSLEQK